VPAAPLILASTSPYRRTLLERLRVPFGTQAPGIEEAYAAQETPPERARRLALAKAQAVGRRFPEAVVIGSDQVAAAAGAVLDKPGDAVRARAQLAQLAGGGAQFFTACAVIQHSRAFLAEHLDTTQVTFRSLTAQEIERYLAQDCPFDCAGSFKSEALGITLLERLESVDPTALIGLPLIWLAQTLRSLGYALP
jgi:septum formation protein